MVGTQEQHPTKAEAERAAGYLRRAANCDNASQAPVTMGMLIDKYRAERLTERYSTRYQYICLLRKHIELKWRDYPLSAIKPLAVEQWLSTMELAPKTKGHIRNLMHRLFACAIRWELLYGANPMHWVEVRT